VCVSDDDGFVRVEVSCLCSTTVHILIMYIFYRVYIYTTNIHIFVNIRAKTIMHTFFDKNIDKKVCAIVVVYAYTKMYLYLYIYVYINKYIQKVVRVYIYKNIFIFIYIYVY